MSYVNEYISEEDLIKYNFAALDKRISRGGSPNDFWVIDRELDVWLREFSTEMDHTELDGGFTGVVVWDFYWKGTLMSVELKNITGGKYDDEHRWTKKKLIDINIPSELENKRPQIIQDLEIALNAHGICGLLSTTLSYLLRLEV